MADQDTVFAQGMIVKERNPQAPEWVIANLSFKVDEFTKTLAENADNGWVNVTVCQSRGGKMYGKVDTWKPTQQGAQQPPAPQTPQTTTPPPFDSNEPIDDVPF